MKQNNNESYSLYNSKAENESTDNQKTDDSGNNKDEKIRDMAAVSVESDDNRIYCMSIIGEIEGHTILPPQSKTTKYEHIIP